MKAKRKPKHYGECEYCKYHDNFGSMYPCSLCFDDNVVIIKKHWTPRKKRKGAKRA